LKIIGADEDIYGSGMVCEAMDDDTDWTSIELEDESAEDESGEHRSISSHNLLICFNTNILK
jgi:hypothetical protein